VDRFLAALAGWLAGIVSALVATECATWRDRRRTKADLAKGLSAELSANNRRLESAQSRVSKTVDEEKPYRMTGAAFGRAVFNAGIEKLALLPRDAMDAVIRAYACLDDVEHIVEEWRWLESPWPVGEPRPERAMQAIRNMQTSFKERTELAMERVGDALAELNKVG
jgi:hypothetical protein